MFFYDSAWSGDYISLPFELRKKDDGHIVVYSETGDEISSLIDIVTEERLIYNETQQYKNLKENFDKARAKFTSNICTCEILLLIITGAIVCLSGLLIKRVIGSAVAICAVSVIWILLVCAITWIFTELLDYEDTKKGKKLTTEISDSFSQLVESAKTTCLKGGKPND